MSVLSIKEAFSDAFFFFFFGKGNYLKVMYVSVFI